MAPQSPNLPPAVPEVVSTRVFPVPRATLFEAFSRPEALARWWGPEAFTNEFHEFDLRPGGRWRFDMIGPDGTRYPQDKTFLEVEPPSRIVFEHAQKGHDFRMTITFEEIPGGTRLTWRLRFASAAELAAVESHIIAGNEQNFDRLTTYLATTGAPATGSCGA